MSRKTRRPVMLDEPTGDRLVGQHTASAIKESNHSVRLVNDWSLGLVDAWQTTSSAPCQYLLSRSLDHLRYVKEPGSFQIVVAFAIAEQFFKTDPVITLPA